MIATLSPALAAAVGASAFYVSPAGDDAAAGDSPSAPWRTLEHAQAQARAAVKNRAGAVSVSLLDGIYRVNRTWTFNEADSNTVWQAAPGAAPVVTASMAVPWSEFKPSADPRLPGTAAGKVSKLKLTDLEGAHQGLTHGKGVAGWEYRDTDRLQVFFGAESGVPLTLARYPNAGAPVPGSKFVGYATGSDGYIVPNASEHTNTTVSSLTKLTAKHKADAFSFGGALLAEGMAGRPHRWASSGGAPQLAVHGAWRFEWADQMMSVVHTNLTNQTFIFESKRTDGLRYWPPMAGCPYYVLDLLQELDSPGEWWLDRSTDELFVYPPVTHDAGDTAAAPSVELTIELPTPPAGVSTTAARIFERGGPALVFLENVVNLTISGISIRRSRGMGLLAVNCSDLLLEKIDATGFAGQAAEVSGGTNVTLRWWNVSHMGAGGVLMKGGDRETLTPAGHSLLDSELSFTDSWVTYEVPAVSQQGVGTTVAHNYVHDVKHHAFRQGGNNHLVEMNMVKDVLLECWDCGAYHTGRDITWLGNVIRHNVNINNDSLAQSRFPCAKGSSCQKVAWYMDDHMSGVTVTSNVVVGYQTGVFFHFGRNNNASGNIFIDCNASVVSATCLPLL